MESLSTVRDFLFLPYVRTRKAHEFVVYAEFLWSKENDICEVNLWLLAS